jgi:hypothetical protein
MASYIATANGNFNTAATWHTVSANSLLDSEAGTSEPAAGAYSESATFQPGAVTCDGIAVKLADAGTGAYTISCHLYQTGVAEVAGTAVTINRADLCSATTTGNEGGWVFFEWTAPVLLLAATNYTVGLQESNAAANVLFYRNGTAFNWSRMLRTTTDAAAPPAATSILHIMERKTGAGAATTVTVTMDAIAAAITKYGSGTDDSACLTISDGGTLNYAFAAATAYYLQLDGNLIVYNQGTLTIGTVANPIPRDGSAILEFDPTADGGMGLIVRNGGTFTAQGLSRTVAKNVVSCLLNTDEAIASTSLGVDTDTGWLDNDRIAVASTTRTAGQCETGLLNGAAAAATLTVDGFGGAGGGLAYAHSGISPTQAEVILLTRNVKIRSSSATIMAYVVFKSTSTVDIDWVEFCYLGQEASDKTGISIQTTTGSCNIQYSSVWNCEDAGFYSGSVNNLTISYTVTYNTPSVAGSYAYALYLPATAGATITISNNIFMYGLCSAGAGAFGLVSLGDVGITFTGNTVIGQGTSSKTGLIINESGAAIGTFSGITIHSCAGDGLGLTPGGAGGGMPLKSPTGTLSTLTIWRNSGFGIAGTSLYYSGSDYAGRCFDLTINTATLFGNGTSNIDFGSTGSGGDGICIDCANVTLLSVTANGDATFSTTNGINFGYSGFVGLNIKLINCDFSTAAGAGANARTAHTNDIAISAAAYLEMFCHYCKFGATTEVLTQSNLNTGSYIKSSGNDQDRDFHRTWFKYGTVETDSAANMFRTAAPSMRLTPNNASNKLESGSFKVNVQSGQTCTPSVYVRESVVGDGTDYNGNRIRIIVKRNDAIGITADQVLDTATVASEGAFEEIGAVTAAASADGVMEFVVDCDGTTGWINIDDFTATVA